MEELRQTFLADSISRLENLRNKITAETLSPEFEREALRTLHTIKGTAQTFGLPAAAHLAHELENLLAASRARRIPPEELSALLPEGIEILSRSLANKYFRFSPEFAGKMEKYAARKADSEPFDENSLGLPAAIVGQMSKPEKTNLRRALADGNNLEILEIGFAPETLAAEYKNFRARLSEKGEIIAAFPCPRFAAENKIGFQLIFATYENPTDFLEGFPVTRSGPAVYQAAAVAAPSIAAQIAEYGARLAAGLGKKIEFETAVSSEAIAPRAAQIIFEALLHLVRNAVDHGIERRGKIKIEIASDPGGIFLRVSDDGRGIDAEKVRRTAVEKNLLAADAPLSETEVLNLIFAHGFSTGAAVSEISGRGVGLDAVKSSVETAGGEIRVESEPGKGTTFEIFLKEK